jgi:hypothetical protein
MSERGPAFLCALGYVYAAEGRRDEASRIVEELVASSKVRYVPASTVAVVLSGLGEKDEAMKWLERADRERDPWVTALNTNFMFDPIRSDPRFQSLAHRVGLS